MTVNSVLQISNSFQLIITPHFKTELSTRNNCLLLLRNNLNWIDILGAGKNVHNML